MKANPLFIVVVIPVLLSLGACTDNGGETRFRDAAAPAAMAERALTSNMVAAQKSRNPYLAYEHYFRIKLPEGLIRESFEATLDQCSSGDFHECTLIESSLNE
ncbi:MAG: hypothetical protein WDZ30_11770 [Cellvibrionaceae bacterium]